jgi:type II secretory pathway component GspD/PulD (secretin)
MPEFDFLSPSFKKRPKEQIRTSAPLLKTYATISMKAHTIISALLTSLFFASCQSSSPTLQPSAAPLQPLPAWTKSKLKTSKNAQQVKIETKLIEITYLPGAKDIPTKRSQKHLNKTQLQTIMRSLAQRKGADIMTAPSVVIPVGQIGTVEIIKEFIYPLPGKKKEFKTENLGVIETFRIHPLNSGKKITFNALVQVKEHLGFETEKSNPAQPIFKERRFDEKVTLTSGHSILFRGLISDQQQKIEDATPVLSDLPLFGPLFTKKSTENFQTELILLVTATRLDATGKPN